MGFLSRHYKDAPDILQRQEKSWSDSGGVFPQKADGNDLRANIVFRIFSLEMFLQ